jgi:hypothetical protein
MLPANVGTTYEIQSEIWGLKYTNTKSVWILNQQSVMTLSVLTNQVKPIWSPLQSFHLLNANSS